MTVVTSTKPGLLPRLRVWFGLSQAGLGRCLGLSKMMVSQVERGVRELPLRAAPSQVALTLARHQVPEYPTPEPLDPQALRRHQRACQHQADNLTFELTRLAERAAWARRRLAALATLTSVLAPDGAEPPAWLADFAAEARAELTRSGTTAQARLQLRRAGLLAEVTETEHLLAAPEPD